MKKIFCMLLLGLCLVSMSACENKTVSNNSAHFSDLTDNEQTIPKTDTTDSDEYDYAINDAVKESVKESEKESVGESEKESVEEETNHVASNDIETEDNDTKEESVDDMRPEFMEAMDSYEAFYDEYCEVINKYVENPSDIQLHADYKDMTAKEIEISENFEAWEDNDLNDAEFKYYLEVDDCTTRKLLEVSE